MVQAAKEKLGLYTSTSLVVGNMIGAGVFLMPAAMASFGSISLLGWIISAVGSFFLARVFSNLSMLLPRVSGGPYAYARHGLGDFIGFLVAWGYWLSCICACAAITISLVSAMSTFFPVLAVNTVSAVCVGLFAISFLTWINTRGLAISGKMQLATTILKLLPLVVIAIGGLFFIRIENFHPFNSSGTSVLTAITTTATMTMFSYVGIESATVPAGNVNDPGKTVSRATMLGLLIAAFVYIMGSLSVIGIVPHAQLQHSLTPYADAAVVMFGSSARYWVSGGVAIAAFGALNGWTLIQGQVPFAIAQDKLFPPVFARLNKQGMPYTGMVISSALVSLIMSMNYTKGLVEQFRILLYLSIFTMLVPYLLSVTSYLIIRIQKENFARKGLAGAIVLAALAFSYVLWEMTGAGATTVYHGFMLLMVSIPFYTWIVYKNNKAAQ